MAAMPQCSKSVTFLVATGTPKANAIAAICASNADMGIPLSRLDDRNLREMPGGLFVKWEDLSAQS
jgi:hypothetical protein